MHLVRDMEPRSGLNLVDPAHPATVGRTTPTLLVLPRGHFHGGRSGHGYSFPALKRPKALPALVDEALHRFCAATGGQAARGRLILTAHSGGGAALMEILRHLDPDEVHVFDALHRDPAPLIAWAGRRQSTGTGALRVLFRPGEATAVNSLRVAAAIGTASSRFRVEETMVSHDAIPRTYGWMLLADSAADLPGAGRPGSGGSTSRGVDVQEWEVPAPAPAVSQAPTVPPAPAVSPLGAAIARVAAEELRRWRPGGGHALTETSPAASAILREYYQVGVGTTVTDAQMQSRAYHKVYPWSAVFVSYVMCKAGAGSAFPRSALHQDYIRATRQNRLNNDTARPFWAFRATEAVPQVGDLVCVSREGSGTNYDTIGDSKLRLTHCDIVTDVQPGRIRVVGGNVHDTVTETPLRTLPDGRLILTGDQSLIFAVIRCRPNAAWLPTPCPPSAAPQPGPMDKNARVLRVMDLLTGQYGYPVNAAAGIVGNLMEESDVMPNRLEGSKEATPMRTWEHPPLSAVPRQLEGEDCPKGRVRDFTPEEVRDRSRSRRTGPCLPGVGLAQWTEAGRRLGLFRHTFRGRQLGVAILFDLDAQVDYLDTELRSPLYARVRTTLMTPGVTVDQASDTVLLEFEKPKDARTRIPKRRANAAEALRIYRAARGK
jgi:hypothetical protein